MFATEDHAKLAMYMTFFDLGLYISTGFYTSIRDFGNLFEGFYFYRIFYSVLFGALYGLATRHLDWMNRNWLLRSFVYLCANVSAIFCLVMACFAIVLLEHDQNLTTWYIVTIWLDTVISLWIVILFTQFYSRFADPQFDYVQPVHSPPPPVVVTVLFQSDTCSICLESMREDVAILPCAHKFHRACVERWHRQNPTCPMCRM